MNEDYDQYNDEEQNSQGISNPLDNLPDFKKKGKDTPSFDSATESKMANKNFDSGMQSKDAAKAFDSAAQSKNATKGLDSASEASKAGNSFDSAKEAQNVNNKIANKGGEAAKGGTETAAKEGAEAGTTATEVGTAPAEGASTRGAAAATEASATGGSAAAGEGAAAGGSAAGGASLAVVLFWVVLVIVIIMIILGVILSIFNIVNTASTAYNEDEESLVANKDLELEDFTNENFFQNCASNIFTNIGDWFGDLFGLPISDMSQFCRILNDTVEEYETTYDVKLSKGLVVSTILYGYNYSPMDDDDYKEIYEEESKYPEEQPYDILKHLIEKEKVLTREDLKRMIDYQMRKNTYAYFVWDIIETETKTEDGKEKIINYYGCKQADNKQYYFDLDKYQLFLRYGWDSTVPNPKNSKDTPITEFKNPKGETIEYDNFDVAGFTENINYLYYAYGEGYEYDLNLNDSWNSSVDYCRDASVSQPPEIPPSSGNITNKLADNPRNKSLTYFESRDMTEPIDTSLYYYAADYESKEPFVEEKIKTKKIKIGPSVEESPDENGDGEPDGFQMRYVEGFIFIKAPSYKNAIEANTDDKYIYYYDSNATPKYLEYIIENVLSNYPSIDEILGDNQEDDVTDPINNPIIDPGTVGTCKELDYPIRIVSCPECNYYSNIDRQNDCRKALPKDLRCNEYPGGCTESGADHATGDLRIYRTAKSTITLYDYLLGLVQHEYSAYLQESKIEALKLFIIMGKGDLVAGSNSFCKVVNGELQVASDGRCNQVYTKFSGTQQQASIFKRAYDATANVILYKKGTKQVFFSEYRATLQTIMDDYVTSHPTATYIDIFNSSEVQNWYRNPFSNAELGSCEVTSPTPGGGSEPVYTGGDGYSIFKAAYDMYTGTNTKYNNTTLCYIRPSLDSGQRVSTWNGIMTTYKGNYRYHTDCNGFVGLAIRAAVGSLGASVPASGTSGAAVTYFGAGARTSRNTAGKFVKVYSGVVSCATVRSGMSSGAVKPGDIIGVLDDDPDHSHVMIAGQGTKIVENAGGDCGGVIRYRDFSDVSHYNHSGCTAVVWRYSG